MTELSLIERKQWSEDVWEFFWQPAKAVDYQAGQYAHFQILSAMDPRGDSRIFTLTSLPSDDHVSFAAKIGNMPSDFKQKLLSLKKSDKITMGDALGDMVLPRLNSANLTFVAGGLGIASFISLIRECNKKHPSHHISLLWAMRSIDERYNLPVVTKNNLVHSSEFIAPERLTVGDIIASTPKDGLVYLSGSEKFVISLRQSLHERGITDSRILFDYFSGYDEL